MRIFKLRGFYKVTILLVLLVVFGSSCMEEDPGIPVGTWSAVKTFSVSAGNASIKDIMTFTETSFIEVIQIQPTTGQWTDYIQLKGSVFLSGKLLNGSIEEAGIYQFNPQTGLPADILTTYPLGSPEFDDLLAGADQTKTFKAEFSVSGNQLTFQKDLNGDGDFGDEFETTVYTKL